MKFAYLVMTELRSLEKNIKDLYKYIIDPFEADIFICVQETTVDDSEKIKLFTRNVVYSEIYKKPNPYQYFGKNNSLNINYNDSFNWNKPSNLQIYINYHKMGHIIKNLINNYDYFITMRTDVSILFPFPEKSFLNSLPQSIYFFDTEYSKGWSGSGYSVFIHKNFIFSYLCAYYFVISNKIFRNTLKNIFYDNPEKKLVCNQEKFQKICLKIIHMPNPIYIKNTNLFYNATTLKDYTTWSSPIMHPKYNVICKYIKQCDEAYDNLYLWNDGYRWKYENNSLVLKK
jgi:hypothetical protein